LNCYQVEQMASENWGAYSMKELDRELSMLRYKIDEYRLLSENDVYPDSLHPKPFESIYFYQCQVRDILRVQVQRLHATYVTGKKAFPVVEEPHGLHKVYGFDRAQHSAT
jgi:hypothetical protein